MQVRINAWLINTGWTGGPYGTGNRIKLAHTRAIIDAIHSGELARGATAIEPRFGLTVPAACPNCPTEILLPRNTWQDNTAYDVMTQKLAGLFMENFADYSDGVTPAVQAAGFGGK